MGTGVRRYDGLQCVGVKTVIPTKVGTHTEKQKPKIKRNVGSG